MNQGASQSIVQSDTWSTYIRLGHLSLPLRCRINETAYWLHLSKAKVLPAGSSSGSGAEAPAENFFIGWEELMRSLGGAVWWWRGCGGGGGGAGLAAFVLRFVLFFDVVVDVPVVQVVDVGSSSSWTWLSSCPSLCKIGVWSRQCSPWSSAVAVLGQGGDMPFVATTGAVLGQGSLTCPLACNDRGLAHSEGASDSVHRAV